MIELILENPLQAITITALAACGGLALVLYRLVSHLYDRNSDDMDRQSEALMRLENKLAGFEINLASAMSETRGALLTHSADLGKASKAITGEMLKVRDQVMSLKEDLGARIDRLREFAQEMEREFDRMADSMSKTLKDFGEQVGGVKRLSERVDESFGRIIHLEENSEKYAQMFRSAAQAINVHKERLGKLEGKK